MTSLMSSVQIMLFQVSIFSPFRQQVPHNDREKVRVEISLVNFIHDHMRHFRQNPRTKNVDIWLSYRVRPSACWVKGLSPQDQLDLRVSNEPSEQNASGAVQDGAAGPRESVLQSDLESGGHSERLSPLRCHPLSN